MSADQAHPSKSTLATRASEAISRLADCHLCPRACGANRLAEERGVCGIGRRAVVSAAFPHFGEEACLVSTGGSGTIFFCGCNLRCAFCQNQEISHGSTGREVSDEDLARLMMGLQDAGCANINLVTPTHVVPQILAALALAMSWGLRLPIVYNSSGYDGLYALRLLDGVVDVYLPDFKFWSRFAADRYAGAPDYPACAVTAITEMVRQVGGLSIDAGGNATRGVIVRHLVMPGGLDASRHILAFLAGLSPRPAVNIMDQYRPLGRAAEFAEISRRPTAIEITESRKVARELGLTLSGA